MPRTALTPPRLGLRSGVGALALLLAATSAPHAAGADGELLAQDGPPLVPAQVEADGLTVTVYPSRIGIDRSRQFDEQGRTQRAHSRMSMHFQCSITGEPRVLAYRDHGIDRMTDGWGQPLDPPARDGHAAPGWQAVQQPHAGNPGDAPTRLSFNLSADAPGSGVQHFAEIAGRIELLVPDSELRAVRLFPIGDFMGKRVRVRDVEDAILKIDRNAQHGEAQLQLSMPADIMARVSKVRFFDADGHTLPGGDNMWNRRQGPVETRIFRSSPDNAAGMEVQIFPVVRAIDVPWVVHDVPLPAPPKAGPVQELALDTEPLGAGPQIPGLEIEVAE